MRFRQVDVFSREPLRGNPVAVVHEADGVTDAQMAAFARWTNLSETTFLLTPTVPEADYRLRIWTPGGELPFAGHPTLGSAHAWLEEGGRPAGADVVQECGAGLVRLRRGQQLGFDAPPLIRSGDVAAEDLEQAIRAIGVSHDELLGSAWIDNGPGWMGLHLTDADRVLSLNPDWAAMGELKIGVVGRYSSGPFAAEVRAFCPAFGMPEDPVTGSLNAGIAQWLAGSELPLTYVASQGTALGRAGRIHLDASGDDVWVSGDTTTTIAGDVAL